MAAMHTAHSASVAILYDFDPNAAATKALCLRMPRQPHIDLAAANRSARVAHNVFARIATVIVDADPRAERQNRWIGGNHATGGDGPGRRPSASGVRRGGERVVSRQRRRSQRLRRVVPPRLPAADQLTSGGGGEEGGNNISGEPVHSGSRPIFSALGGQAQ